jgi:aminoglycoside phosphotransferase (APT) family kinase protein
VLSRDDLLLLETILKRFDVVESHWSIVECLYAVAPRCLVHRDFFERNVRVCTKGAKPVLYVIDWESAGWDVPALDLRRLDLVAYWTVVRETWPQLDLKKIREMANLGVILRFIPAITWVSRNLAHEWVYELAYEWVDEWVESQVSELMIYESRLAHALQVAHWV